jgi:DNA-binding XRE family transcriptional regulator
MSFQHELARAIETAPLPALANDLLAVAHKLRYPMAAILAKVPGDTLAARARAIGVSRQTMYVWAQEKFRPSTEQATIIAELTGVPIEEIREFQEGNHGTDKAGSSHGGAGKTPRKTRPRLAKASRSLPAGAARVRAKRGGVGLKQGKRGHSRTLRKRTKRGLVSGEGD